MMFMTLEPQPSGGFEWTQAPWGAVLQCRPLAAAARHLFTTGNLRLVDHEREWSLVAAEMDVAPDAVQLIRQVHGVDVAIARSDAGSSWHRPQADIILSDDPSVAIGVRVADCAPVLLADRRLGVVGAAHAGWRGTVRGAAAVAVEALGRTFGSRAQDLIAAIGPCLGPCCGEVGPEVVEAFRAAGHADALLGRWFSRGMSGRPYLNLWRANRDQLEGAGIAPANIHSADICTRTHAALFHSYRAAGTHAGRMAALIRARRG